MLYRPKSSLRFFFATCARLLPNDVRVTVEQQLPGNLSAEDWSMMREIVAAVRQAIPDGRKRMGRVVPDDHPGMWGRSNSFSANSPSNNAVTAAAIKVVKAKKVS
jgi:hypothetical protein